VKRPGGLDSCLPIGYRRDDTNSDWSSVAIRSRASA
jgi:hypothetical protein